LPLLSGSGSGRSRFNGTVSAASLHCRPVRTRRADWSLAGALGAVCYIPLFLSRPGMVAADTKQYLYLDPGRLTTGAASMWDPNTGLGTVTHQNIGYLFPMGPYYSAVKWLGIPMWVGQRIWMGSLMVAAGLGVAYCARRLGLEGPGRVVAAFTYALSPYILDYLDRISAILMPWAALGWLIGLTAEAARSGRWRHPAIFALIVALVGGVNATSIVLVLAAPLVWLVYAVWVSREVSLKRAAGAGGRIALLSALVSVWWAAGLWAEDRYGINILRVTETVPTVARTSSAAEVLRGLGYWYFYGWDKVQPWTQQAVPYTQSPWLIAVSLGLPAVAIVLGLVTRWIYRGFCLALVGVGTVVAVGAFPITDPSLFGSLIKGASAGSTIALAMRSVDRIVPLVLAGLALLMGCGVTAIRLRRPSAGWAATLACLGLVAADLPALWTGGIIASNLSRPSTIPSYVTAAASYLGSQGSSTRVLGLPGEDFAAYSWGVTQDPVFPGLTDRPYVSRQVVPNGTPAAANLLQALDQPIQEGTFEPAALAPVARLMSVGQVLLQSDLQYERYTLPLPQVLWQSFDPPPPGLSAPTTFGGPNPAPMIRYRLDNQARLGIPTGTPQPPALAVFDVSDPRSIVRTEPVSDPVVVAGDGFGIVEASSAGLLDRNPTVLYAAALPRGSAPPTGSTIVATDTNPLAQYKWGSLRDNVGQVEQPGAGSLVSNPSEYTLPVFPGETTADQTIAVVTGIKSVRATDYGYPESFTPETKPLYAVDGDPSTAWSFGDHEPVGGTRIQIDLKDPVTTNHVTLHQLKVTQPIPRRITSVTLLFDGKSPVTVPLTSASVAAAGQVVSFPTRTFSQLQVVVNGATGGHNKRYDGLPEVGFTEISIPGVPPAGETLRLPTDALAGSAGHPLDILMQRNRVSGPPRHDPEPQMSRTFVLPSARSFDISGTAEMNWGDSDYLINQLIGLTPPGPLPPTATTTTPGPATVIAANSSTRLDGDRRARANATVDGNPGTAWIAETGPQAGEWLSLTFNKPVTFDHLDLQLVNDGRHSLPSRITISSPTGNRTLNLQLPPVGYGRPQGATSTVPVSFPALSGGSVRVTIDAVQQVRELDYYSTFAGLTDILPVGIAELGLPGVVQPEPPAQVPAVCTGGLISIDGKPVDVEVTGATASALAGSELTVSACGNSAGGVELGPGPHTLTTSPRLPIGWSVDQLWLSSAAGGHAVPLASTVIPAPGSPSLAVLSQNRTSMTVRIKGDGRPFWLVLGQSFSSGWHAAIAGGRSLGPPHLIDGYANGWYMPASNGEGVTTVNIEWTPQRFVWAAIGVSGAALLLTLLIAVLPSRAVAGDRRVVPGPEPASWRNLVRLDGLTGRSLLRTLLAALTWGALVAVVSRPAIGAAAAVATVIACRLRAGRAVCRLAAVASLLALPLYVVSEQVAYRYWPDINWPSEVSSANDLAWLGLALVGADVLAGFRRRRQRANV
jgi:arabinofuranan 3-O-arabinosyltransferase